MKEMVKESELSQNTLIYSASVDVKLSLSIRE